VSASSSTPPASRARLVLASASPRRKQLLRDAGFEFIVHPADIDETDHPAGLLPGDLAQWLAAEKARVVAERFPDDVVLAADTVVASADGQILGKPADAAHARAMLQTLAGTIHEVITGVAVVCLAREIQEQTRVTSTVHMRALTEAEIATYVASNEWMGKAGGYGIQDADPFVTRVAGDLTNIVGLPVTTTVELLAKAGIRSRQRADQKDNK
jgi:septum formation protein